MWFGGKFDFDRARSSSGELQLNGPAGTLGLRDHQPQELCCRPFLELVQAPECTINASQRATQAEKRLEQFLGLTEEGRGSHWHSSVQDSKPKYNKLLE